MADEMKVDMCIAVNARLWLIAEIVYVKRWHTMTDTERNGYWMSSILVECPVIAYKTFAIDVYTGDEKLDYEFKKQLIEDLKPYKFNPDHEHVR